ncbi:hypothetical protein ABFS82_07G084100 [Erythranthe guttata]
MYSSRDNWERLVTAVVRKQQIWELFHSHSRTPSISTIASSDDNDDFSEQFLDNRWAATSSSVSPLPLNNPPSVTQVIGNPYGEAITRKLFPASWYRAKETKQEYHIFNIPGVRTFSLNELKIATDNFADKNTLFRDVFVKSYKGRLENGFMVVVKRFKQVKKNISPAEQQYFHAEVEMMRIVAAHPNLLGVIGGCLKQKEKLLVYPYMANGTVASFLRDRPESRPPLDWSVRKRIALGAARGLAYLHDGCERKIIHRDVKAANIYLNKDFDAIIGNFELAIHMDHGVTHVEEKSVPGAIRHIAPEYLSTLICSEKSDVYGYGMFLLELITGQRVVDLARIANDKDLMLIDWVKTHVKEKEWVRIVDPYIGGNSYYYIEEEVEQLIQIARLCTQDNPERRPNMSDIVRVMLPLGVGDGLLLAQRWEEFCNEEIMIRSDEQLDLILPDSPMQSDELSSPR